AASGASARLRMRTTASPISRMSTSFGMDGGSLADLNYGRRVGFHVRLMSFGSNRTRATRPSPGGTLALSARRLGKLRSGLAIEVYGIYLLVRLVPDEDAAIQLQCPKGASIL